MAYYKWRSMTSFLKCNVNIEISMDIIKDISNACTWKWSNGDWSVVQLNHIFLGMPGHPLTSITRRHWTQPSAPARTTCGIGLLQYQTLACRYVNCTLRPPEVT